MKVTKTELGVLLIEPDVFGDARGFFMETYQEERYRKGGIKIRFVQDNLSYSLKGTLRGLHYQLPHAQAKLVQVLDGEVFDVVVDIRKGSPNFGKWISTILSGENRRQLFIPEGFAHGFCVVSPHALFTYKCSDFYDPPSERGVIWSDPDLAIPWPVEKPLLSQKDEGYPRLREIPADRLPAYAPGEDH